MGIDKVRRVVHPLPIFTMYAGKLREMSKAGVKCGGRVREHTGGITPPLHALPPRCAYLAKGAAALASGALPAGSAWLRRSLRRCMRT